MQNNQVVKPIVKYIYIHDNYNIASDDTEKNIEVANFKVLTNSEINKSLGQAIRNQESGIINKAILNPCPISNSHFPIPSDLGLSIEVKNSMNWNVPSESINPLSYAKLNNMDLSVFYSFGNNIKIGGNIKQETFYTVYTGTEPDGSLYKYRQQPNFTTYSLAGRYNMQSSQLFSPYLQIAFGVNQGGYVAKSSVGVEYKLLNSLSFILGIEYGYFHFNHQNNWFNTSKWSFNYGLSFQL